VSHAGAVTHHTVASHAVEVPPQKIKPLLRVVVQNGSSSENGAGQEASSSGDKAEGAEEYEFTGAVRRVVTECLDTWCVQDAQSRAWSFTLIASCPCV